MTTAIIGAGPSGIECAHCLAVTGGRVLLFEQEEEPMVNIRSKAMLFPEFRDASELVSRLEIKIEHPSIELHTKTRICDMWRESSHWCLKSVDGTIFEADDVVLSTGYRVFDASRKEELGYGIYKGVITSMDMEKMLLRGRILNPAGDLPRKVVFLQCVGSRDMKVGNNYCSKVCCVTAAKQAIEVRRLLPDAEIYIFYMDLRMWGQGFEEVYRQSQQDYDIRYIRGRICEAASTFDDKIQIKAEDTLTGLPVKMSTDLLVLMVGMEPSVGTVQLGKRCGICGEYGFVRSLDRHLYDNCTEMDSLYLCGACKRPMCIEDVIADARSAAMEIIKKR